MPFENTEVLEFNQYQKSDKASSITYADFECIIEKVDACKNNPITKVSKQFIRFFNAYNIFI